MRFVFLVVLLLLLPVVCAQFERAEVEMIEYDRSDSMDFGDEDDQPAVPSDVEEPEAPERTRHIWDGERAGLATEGLSAPERVVEFPWIIVAIGALLIIFGVVAALKLHKKKTGPDYYTFFVLGLSFTVLGIFGMLRDGQAVFFILGLVFIAVGLVHKDEWKKNHVKYGKLTPAQRKLIIAMIAVGVVVLLLLLLRAVM